MDSDTLQTAPSVDALGLRHVDDTPTDRDWSEGYGDRWEPWEVETCDGCGALVVGTGYVECDHEDHRDGFDDRPAELAQHLHDDHETPGALTLSWTELDEAHAAEHEDPTEVYVGDGPMMNYAYPCEVDDPEDAARKLDGLPLCIVEWGDGTTELVLTGGGMDLSWEICAAYVRLGYVPPIHFASLPNMAGGPGIPTDEARRVVAALARGLRHVRDAAGYRLTRLLADSDDLLG